MMHCSSCVVCVCVLWQVLLGEHNRTVLPEMHYTALFRVIYDTVPMTVPLPQCLRRRGRGAKEGVAPKCRGKRKRNRRHVAEAAGKKHIASSQCIRAFSHLLASPVCRLTRSNPPTIPIITTGITSATRSGSRCITEGAPMGDLDQHLNHHPCSTVALRVARDEQDIPIAKSEIDH